MIGSLKKELFAHLKDFSAVLEIEYEIKLL